MILIILGIVALVLLGIMSRIAKKTGLKIRHMILALFCWIIGGFFLYDSNYLEWMLQPQIVAGVIYLATPIILIFVFKLIWMFLKWSISGLLPEKQKNK
jgi:hypothetical protein